MKKLLGLFLCVMLVGFFAAPAMALPLLQLDIIGGSYDPITESTIGGKTGTLVALLDNTKNLYDPSITTYYISAALIPVNPNYNGGNSPSLTYGGTGSLSSGMSGMPNGLQPHGIFPPQDGNYYWEFSFEFDTSNTIGGYDVQTGETANHDIVAAYFDYDVSSLIGEGYYVHFDLYNKVDGKVFQNAPFSHDATAAPEPATLLLLGTGLIGIAGAGRKKIFK